MTVIAWLAAFLIVLTLFSVFGHQLDSLPVALVMSGVMIALMTNLVLPGLNAAAAHCWPVRRVSRLMLPVDGRANPAEVDRSDTLPVNELRERYGP